MSELNHPNLTPWGYMVDAQTIPDFLTAQEFAAFTNSKFGFDARIESNIPSATAAIRNYCGWHISPELTCAMIYRIFDLRDAFVGHDVLIQLPATYVTGIEKVIIGKGQTIDELAAEGDPVEYDLNPSGILRLYDVFAYDRKTKVYIKYKAGLPDENITTIKELAANRVTHAVSNSYGIVSEAAGGVSVSYSTAWAGNTRSTSLPDDSKEVLEVYKIKGVY